MCQENSKYVVKRDFVRFLKEDIPDEVVLSRVIVPEFESHVILSLKRRIKYYKEGTKIPKRFAAPGYQFKDGFLVGPDGARLIRNPKSAGSPKRWKINGQALYSGALHHHARKKAAEEVHRYLRPYVRKIPVLAPEQGTYIGIRLDIFDLAPAQLFDVSNQWPWIKWFEDTLVECRKMPEDDIRYVRDSGRIRYFPVQKEKDRKLVFTMFQTNT